ncbi:MAG TPA: HAD family phosphatase [Anaerolineales bacterium]|jgi:epoxide hydrolase-like predicted phosphatase|nr:HAD family phosphatase [Anaerolineales bacterium]
MTIKAVIWDVGGVLERTEDSGPRRALAERLGWEMGPLMDLVFGNNDAHRAQLGQISLADHWQNVRRTLGQTEDELKRTIEEFFAGDELDTQLVNAIRRMREDYTTAILSNYFPILRDKVNHQWKIGDAFDHLVVSAEVGVKKPDPKIFRIVLDSVECSPGEAVFIDDMAENIAAARAVGLHAVHFQTRDQALNTLNSLLQQHGSNSQ